jgi:hypothetical protein
VKPDQFPKLISGSLIVVIFIVALLGWKLRRQIQVNQDLLHEKAVEIAKAKVAQKEALVAQNQLKTQEELLQMAKIELQRLRKASQGRASRVVPDDPQTVPGGPNAARDPVILKQGQTAPWDGYLVDHPYFAKSVACLQLENKDDPDTLPGCIAAREASEKKLKKAKASLGFWKPVGLLFGSAVIGTLTYEALTPGKQIFK